MKKALRSKTIGLIGCGNMGSAILEGLLSKRMVAAARVFVCDIDRQKAYALSKRCRTRMLSSGREVSRRADVLILAVKPQDLFSAAEEIRDGAYSGGRRKNRTQTLISILAGTPLRKIKRLMDRRVSLVRAMPNLGAQAGESMTVITGAGGVHMARAEAVFSACGKVIRLPEKYFDVVTAVSGSGPAYFFLMMELLAKFGKRSGLSKKNAELLAVQTALGAALLVQSAGESPDVLRKRVTSKKGTTEAALSHLSKRGFEKLFSEAISRAVKRSRELSRG